MSQNTAVLAFHFLLELTALAAVAYWGWSRHDGIARWALAIGLPVAAAAAWAIFRAPGDGPQATVAIQPMVRLALEWLILGGSAFLLWQAGQPMLAGVLAVCIVVDYAFQYDRVARLLSL